MKTSIKKINLVSNERQWFDYNDISEVIEKIKNGDSDAELLLAYHYFYDKDDNYDLVYDIVSKYKFKDDVYAQRLLAILYLDGKGVEKSESKAIEILLRPEFKDFPSIKNVLSYIYLDELSEKKEYKKGFLLALESVKEGYIESYYDLGWCYFYGNGVPRSYKKCS